MILDTAHNFPYHNLEIILLLAAGWWAGQWAVGSGQCRRGHYYQAQIQEKLSKKNTNNQPRTVTKIMSLQQSTIFICSACCLLRE
jgi:hypothetical protein